MLLRVLCVCDSCLGTVIRMSLKFPENNLGGVSLFGNSIWCMFLHYTNKHYHIDKCAFRQFSCPSHHYITFDCFLFFNQTYFSLWDSNNYFDYTCAGSTQAFISQIWWNSIWASVNRSMYTRPRHRWNWNDDKPIFFSSLVYQLQVYSNKAHLVCEDYWCVWAPCAQKLHRSCLH